MRNLFQSLVLGAPLLAGAACCAHRPGMLSGRWVMIAGDGSAVGVAAPPSSGEPLSLRPPTARCFDDPALRRAFGDVCEVTEAEARGTSNMTSDAAIDPTLGNHPTPFEVRWFCDRRTVLRIVIERCEGTNAFRLKQIAVSREGG
jgi:hypothetical protein